VQSNCKYVPTPPEGWDFFADTGCASLCVCTAEQGSDPRRTGEGHETCDHTTKSRLAGVLISRVEREVKDRTSHETRHEQSHSQGPNGDASHITTLTLTLTYITIC